MATGKVVLMVPIVPQDHMKGTIITNGVLIITIKAGLLVIVVVIPTIGVEDIPIIEAGATPTIEAEGIQITVAEIILVETPMEIEETIIADHQIIIEVVAEAIVSQVE
jgi:hypothetical protein